MEERLISVLYVDDESALLEVGKLFLEAGGAFAVDTLTSAQEALILLETTRYDAIISDYQMPVMDGIEFLKALRTRGNTTPFIIFTGKGREEVVIQALNEGADFYLQKGGDPLPQFTELEHKIKTAVQKQRSDKTILHFNRLYAVLSGVNTTIVRAKSREELFAEICRITVEKGEFTMTWIGIIDAAHRTIEPAAHYGFDDGYLQHVQISIDDNPLGQSPCGRAVRERQHVIYNEILREPRMGPWYPEIRKRGYLSTGAFPLFIHNTIVGMLQLYSLEENFFSEGEVRLLDEVASDISFALERLEDEEHRLRTELSLKESEEKLAAVVAGSPVPKFVIDRDHRILYWNRALELATGISAVQVIGTCEQWRAFYGEERPTMADLVLDGARDRINELYAGKIVESPTIAGAIDVIDFFPRMGDNGRWLRFMAAPIRDEAGLTLGAVETLVDITATKRAEEELRRSYETIAGAEEELRQQFDEIAEKEVRLQASEEHYRRFIETSDEGVWSMDPDFRTTFVNQRMAEMLGYSRQEMIGRPILSFMHRDDLADNTRQLADRKNGRSGRYERRFVRKDGTVIQALVSATPLLDEGVFCGSFAMITDISNGIKAENELRATIREYHNLLENMSDVYYRSDTQGNLILASRSWAVLLGYPDLTECIGKNIAQTFYGNPEVRSVFLEKVYRDGSVTDYEVVLKRKDGSLVTVATSSYLYFDESGKLLGVEGTFRDITERKRITDRLREAEQRLSDIIDFLPDATFAIDREGTVIAWNHAIEEMTGVPAGDIVGKGNYAYASPFYGERRPILIDLIFSNDSDLTKNYSWVKRQGNVLTAETGMAHLAGKDLILWGKASPLCNSRGEITGAIESIRDITERKLLEDSLTQVNRKLNLLSAITRHDILNNITVCRAYLAIAKRKSPQPGVQEVLDLIESIVGKIHSQIAFTRVYQDLGASAPVWQDIGELLRKCLDSQDIPVISEVSGIEVYTDPLIGKVFTNLLDNTTRHGEHATGIQVRAEHHNNDVVIIWEDNGIGISPGEKEMIFDRGFGKNTGLGLFLAREILGITGISIRETGEFGKGARFEIRVPKGIWRSVAAGE